LELVYRLTAVAALESQRVPVEVPLHILHVIPAGVLANSPNFVKLVADREQPKKASIPTPGIVVNGCLDECNTCEPARKREVDLKLDRLGPQNKLLAREIQLLEQSKAYRCCPPEPMQVPA
jgi:hypothetical protein